MLQKRHSSLLISFLFVAVTLTRAQNIPSPKEHFGFNIGDNYQLATYTQTTAYFKKLAAASDRVKRFVIGLTEEGREQDMLIVSSPENLKKLDHYKSISQQLAHAEGLSDDQAHNLAAEGKTVVWIDGGLHATEVVGTHQLIETAYQLISRKDPETMRILDNVIILLTHVNPDGQELVSNWYMRETKQEKRTLENVPRLYEKYAGHDNNRDFFMFNLQETRNIGRQLFVEWMPQIMYNHHQAGPAGSVVAGPPFRDPFNYVFDPLIITSIDAVGAAMNNRLNVEGKPGYTQRAGSVFSTWYNGGLRTTTYFHNMVGLLTEIIGSPTPSNIPLITQRLIPNGATPNPVLPRKWFFRQSIDYSVSLNYAVLDYATRYRDELLYNIYKMGQNSIDRGSHDNWTLSPKRIEEINQFVANTPKGKRPARDSTAASFDREDSNAIPPAFFDSVMKNPTLRDPRGYIITRDQPDFPTATKFINALIRAGVLVTKATTAFTVAGKKYSAGSYVIKTNQAFRPHVLDMFEPQDHPNDFLYPGGPPVPPYDAAGWTLAFQMGVKFDRVLDAFDAPVEKIPYGELQAPAAAFPNSAAKGYLLDARSNQSFVAVNDLLAAGVQVFRTTDNTSAGSPGSFYIPASGKATTALKQAAEKQGLDVSTPTSRPSGLTAIKPARVALFDLYGGSIPSGWVRWMTEQYHYNIDLIYPKDIDTGGLRAKYDLIVFVDQGIPPYRAPGSGPQRMRPEPKEADIPAEYRSHLGRITTEKSIPELNKFLLAGGQILTIGSSASLAFHLGIPVRDALVEMAAGKERKLPGEKFYIPGSVLRVQVDSTKQAAWGMGASADIYFDESPVFTIAPEAYSKGTVKPLAWFDTDKPLHSGWAWGQSYLKDGVAAFVASVGKGKLYVFGPEITFRAQTHGAFKFLFNQFYINQ